MQVDEFVLKHLELLELEKEAEVNESKSLQEGVSSKELEKQGICLRKLRIESKRSGLYGRTLVQFGPLFNGQELPSHRLNSGDIVGVTSIGDYGHQDVVISGVIWGPSTKRNSITVAFDVRRDEFNLDDQQNYGLIKLANNITYRRIKGALEDLRRYRFGCAGSLLDILFGTSLPSDPLISLKDDITEGDGKLKFFNKNLNKSQQDAVEFALKQKEVAVVHGPPGTGKTTTLVEIIQQLVAQGLKVLACAPSNVAVDNMGEKLSMSRGSSKIVRLGHPARTLSSSQDISLDALVVRSDNWYLAGDIRFEMEKLQMKICKSNNKNEKHHLRSEVKHLTKDLLEREVRAIKEVLEKSEITLATLTSSYNDGPLKHLKMEHFDVVVIDECSQALEAACWIALLRAPKCILAGDHLQLPPTIVSAEAAKGGLELTLMERLMRLPCGKMVTRMLTTQYRMHESIMKWPSCKLYEDKLVAHDSVKKHLLCDLDGVVKDENTCLSLLLIDTAGCDLGEMELDEHSSKANEGESKLVMIHVEQLIASGVSPEDVAVIVPYNLQVELIRSLLSTKCPDVEVKSVDGFQGREKEAVILSLVRSNEKGEVGFLIEDRRINVAITRARRHLAVICDSDTVSFHPFLKDFIEYLNNSAEVRSAHQYKEELDRYSVGNSVKPHKKVSTTRKSRNNTEEQNCKDNNKTSMLKQPENDSYEKFYKILENFALNDKSETYTFPSSTSSSERRLIHSISEILKLQHESKSDGEHRYITVKKRVFNVQPKPNVNVQKLEIESMTNKFSAISAANEVTVIPEPSVSCTEVEEDEENTSSRANEKRQNKKTDLETRLNEEQKFLDAAVKRSKKCHFPRCKQGIVILRQICNLCNEAFCLAHHIPEAHGCGEAAKTLARQRLLKEKMIVPGSGAISRKPKPQKRAQLEKRLDKKLDDLSKQRTRKKKEKN